MEQNRIHHFSHLWHRVQKAVQAWIEEFIDKNGLFLLLTEMGRLDDTIADEHAQAVHIAACFKAIVNNEWGIAKMLDEHAHIIKHLVALLDTGMLAAKKQIIEILAMIVLYSGPDKQKPNTDGRDLVLHMLAEAGHNAGDDLAEYEVFCKVYGTTSTSFQITSHGILSSLPPHTRRDMCST